MQASGWQTKLSSFKKRHLYAYNKSLFCDVELSVMDAIKGNKVTLPANKYVLAISSPVFEAMFYGELAETGRTIDLPDCTEEGLQEMLRYVYSDEVNLTGSNVLEVLYLAEKYMLPFLKEKCERYLGKELKPEEVFHILPHMRNERIELKCWDLVDGNTERAVSSESFLKISKEMLRKVVGRDTLSIDEVVLFEAVEKWALNKLKEGGLEESIENKRAVLGEDVIKLIRFPLMSEETFANKVLPSGILNMDEVTELIQFFNKLIPLARSFNKLKREGKGREKLPIAHARFESIDVPSCGPNGYWSYSGLSDAIDFKVSKPLYLVGVRLFGNKSCNYDVHLNLYRSENKLKHISSTINSREVENYVGYYGFDVYLDDFVPIDAGVVYTIEATISGPLSYYGNDDLNITIIEKNITAIGDIKITYMNSKKSKNGTSAARGQFPTLLFKRPAQFEGKNK